MKKITKLLSILTPIVTASAIIPIAASCVNKSDDGDEKSPIIKTLNMSDTTSINDLMNDTTPLCVLNENPYSDADCYVEIPAGNTTVLEYNEGDFKGSDIEWKKSGGQLVWTQITASTTLTISHRTPIRFRAYNTTTPGQFSKESSLFKLKFENGGVRLGGSLLSLVSIKPTGTETEWKASLELKSAFVFKELFSHSYAMGSVSPCMLPFTKLTESCYESMFKHCDNLSSVPALPATTLAPSCYKSMFEEIFDLQVAPHLPAKKLAKECYYQMFNCCNHLKSISLSYVGNFIEDDNHYFTNWIGATGTETGIETAGTIYYNGLDTERSVNAIPKNFNIIQNDEFIVEKTVDIQFNDDKSLGTQTSILTSTNKNKNKVRVYKTDTLADLKSFTPPVERKTVGEAPLSYVDKDGKKIADTTLVTAIPDNNVFLRYAQDDFIVNPQYCNIISRETGDKKVTVRIGQKSTNCALQIKVGNNGTWTNWTKENVITLNPGEGVQIRGNLKNTSERNHTEIGIQGKAELDGTIMSLITNDTTTYEPAQELTDYAFYKLFYGSHFVKVSDDFLCVPYDKSKGETPKLMAAKNHCYELTFLYCYDMAEGPAIIPLDPNTSAISSCAYMFQECISMKKAPKLEVNFLGQRQCEGMFYNQYPQDRTMALEDASAIKIGTDSKQGTLNSYSCYWMFLNCAKLKMPPDLSKLSNYGPSYCCQEMFSGCSSLKVDTKSTEGKLFFTGFTSPTNPNGSMIRMMPGSKSPTSGQEWYYHES